MSTPISVSEILQKVQRIQIMANRTVNDLFAGEYHSVFRGRGMEFDEVREYQPGDEIRSIDWNVTARTGTPFIKRFREERELTVLFLVDVSASGVFGSGDRSKLDLAIEVAALLMFSAIKNNDKVGLGMFCEEVHRYLPPRKGKANVLRFLRELIALQPMRAPTRLDEALRFLNRVQKRSAVVFVLSDFQCQGWQHGLGIASRRHDVVAIRVQDPREEALTNIGIVRLQDAETGEIVELDTGNAAVRRWFAEQAATRDRQLGEDFRRAKVDELLLRPDGSSTNELLRFFRRREQQQTR